MDTKTNQSPENGQPGSLALNAGSAIPMWQSLLANYVTDVDDSGTYVLHLGEKETRKLWAEVDAQTAEMKLLKQELRREKEQGASYEEQAEKEIFRLTQRLRALTSPNT